jgi:glycosyltransferase involved in cell wall biosynthesis
MTERTITIYVAGDLMPWSPRDLEGRGIGGAETAVVRVAECLAAQGHAITVHANVASEDHAGVAYRARSAYDPERPCTALIATRAPELFDVRPAAEVALLWSHHPNAGRGLTDARAACIDRTLALSSWHAAALERAHPILAGKIVQIRNGIDPWRFEGSPTRDARVVYASQPERGLDVLLELWPLVRERVPEAELAFCHAPVYSHIADSSELVAANRERVLELAQQSGVRALGSLSQRGLAELLVNSRVLALPSWSSPWSLPFYECSCIAAMEARAAGAWVVASAWGALPETAATGGLIDGYGAPGEPWRTRFADEVVAGLTDPARRQRAETGRAAASELRWETVARHLEDVIDEVLADRVVQT